MEKKYYCPACNEELEMISSCGAVGYFCNHCRKLISRKKILATPGGTPDPDLQDSTNSDQSSDL